MTTTKIDRSALLRNAWRIAREAAASAGTAVRAALGAAFRQAWAEARMVAQPVQQQQAQAVAPADLTTTEGLAKALVGKTASLALAGGEALYTIVSVERWTSPDGAQVRDYIKMETSGMWSDDRKGPIKLFILRKGTGHGTYTETDAGEAFWAYGGFRNSGNKRCNANDMVKDILESIRS